MIHIALTVAAIVKKVAIAILGSDRETKSKIGVVIGTVIAAPFVPLLIIIGTFSSGFDSDSVVSNVKNNLDADLGSYIEVADSNLESIQTAMTDSGFSEIEIREARDIYAIYFIDCGDQEDFVSRFVACFNQNQTSEQLTFNLNAEFGTDIDIADIEEIIGSLSSTFISSTGFQNTTIKNNLDLCTWAEMAYEQHWGYVWGTYGAVLTAASLNNLAEIYPQQVGAARYFSYIQTNYIGRRCVDCAGLMKSYIWYSFDSGKIVYGSNGFQDGNTEAIFARSTEKGPIETMPDIPGVGVYHQGHVGIYVGNGIVIEAMGTTYGMQRRAVSAGTWTHWFMIPGITYENSGEEVSADG